MSVNMCCLTNCNKKEVDILASKIASWGFSSDISEVKIYVLKISQVSKVLSNLRIE